MSLVRRGAHGDVVRVHPGWVRTAYWLVLAALLALVAFAAFAQVPEYTGGPAIVRFTGRTDVVAFEPGTVTGLEVKRGDSFDEGQPLAQLHDGEQLARLHWLDREFERKLVECVRGLREHASANLYDLIVGLVEKPLLRAVLHETNGNQVRAAQILGINRNTLRKKLTEHGIDPDKLER